jgi:alkylation response protein AidB-like acyl-CoA dehydrogenase
MTITQIELEELSVGADYEKVASRFRLVFEKIAQGAIQREKERSLPFEPIQWLKELKLGAVRVPVKYGGDGVSLPQLFQLLAELAQADSNIVQALRGHFAFVEDRLVAHKEHSQEVWFQRFVQGDLVGNAWTEVGNVQIGDVVTRVTKDASGNLVVNGEKYYSTGSIFADWIDLFAYDEVNDRHVIAAIYRHETGVSVIDDWDGFGQKTTGSGTLKVHQVHLPASHLIPFDQRFKYQTAFYQVVHLATLTGIAHAAVETFSQEIRERKRIFSHGNGDLVRHDPQVLQVVGKALQKAYESHFSELEVKEHQFNVDAELESAQGQVVISNLVLDLTSQLFNALGASASSQVKQLDRFWRNARTVSSHNPLIYKEKVIGDWEVNRTDLPFVWQIGASPRAKSA